MINRCSKNPIISPSDLQSSLVGMKVIGTFNAGVCVFNNEIILLLRVAETVIQDDDNVFKAPIYNDKSGEFEILEFDRNDPEIDFSDSRWLKKKSNGDVICLTSISHIRIARSTNGSVFATSDQPFVFPSTQYERFGVEDPRVTEIEGVFYINYSAVSERGITTALASTKDFEILKKHSIIFEPENRDVCLFPEKINGKYWALHRPMQRYIGKPEIWLAQSPDLIHWGEHHFLIGASNDEWDSMKLGGGAQMIKTDKGWLQIYHGVNSKEHYSLGAMLLDINNPKKIIAKSSSPLLEPIKDYEITGFFGHVTFSCGAIIIDDILKIYYGAADEVLALADISVYDLWKHLNV